MAHGTGVLSATLLRKDGVTGGLGAPTFKSARMPYAAQPPRFF
jgi:hypothetical protein